MSFQVGGESVVEIFVRRYGEAVRRQRLQEEGGGRGGGRNSSTKNLNPTPRLVPYSLTPHQFTHPTDPQTVCLRSRFARATE